MYSISVLILLALVMQVHVQELERMRSFDRSLHASVLPHADLDDTTLCKHHPVRNGYTHPLGVLSLHESSVPLSAWPFSRSCRGKSNIHTAPRCPSFLPLQVRASETWNDIELFDGGTTERKRDRKQTRDRRRHEERQKKYGKRDANELLQKVLVSNPEDADAWNNFGMNGGGTVDGQRYSKKECFQKALTLDGSNSDAWNNLGKCGGGIVNGRSYSKAQCLHEALASCYVWSNPENSGDHPMGKQRDADDQYFKAYANLGIHRAMLQDRTRTLAYQRAIVEHPECFKGKVVLDVGCGTGILSIFAARAGARRVYAVEASEIAMKTMQVVQANGFDSVITVLHQRVEDIQLPEKVDVVVSEWMGFLLIFESMLRSVLVARDRWLKDDGHIFPRFANMYVAPYSNSKAYSSHVDFWDDVYGVDMSEFRSLAMEQMASKPHVGAVPPLAVQLAKPMRVMHIDVKTTSFEDAEHAKADFNFTIDISSEKSERATVHGLVLYFDVVFTGPNGPDVILTTAPAEKDSGMVTHWEQTSLFFREAYEVKTGDTLTGQLTIAPNQWQQRFYDISVEDMIQTTLGGEYTQPVDQFWEFNDQALPEVPKIN